MKTSNKILLGLFLLPFVICLFVYGSLYAKYKSDDYITEKQLNEENSITGALPDFTQINISHFKGHVNIENSNDRSIRFEKWNKDHVAYEVKNNTLFIKTTEENNASLTIFCPSFEQLDADSVSIDLHGIKFKDLVLNLGHEANLNFNSEADTLTVNIKKYAGMDFHSRASVMLLNLSLDNHASFESAGQSAGQIKQFGKVQVSDSSEIRMDGKTMRALVEKTGATE